MKLSEDEVRYVARLAHLELNPGEVKQFSQQLSAILEYIEKLNELDTTDVAPMPQVLSTEVELPPLRNDEPRRIFADLAALDNAPDAGHHHFKVPKVITEK